MKKEIKVALITGICSILAGAAGTSLILDLQNSNKNINNNTLIFTNASGQEEVVTAEDYEKIRKDNEQFRQENEKLQQDNEKLQESLSNNQQDSDNILNTDNSGQSLWNALYDGENCEKIGASEFSTEITIGGNQYSDAFQLSGHSAFALFNLEEKYDKVKFDIGRRDKSEIEDAKIKVYLDDVESGVYEIDAETPLTEVAFEVSGASTMKIELESAGYVQYGFVNLEVQ